MCFIYSFLGRPPSISYDLSLCEATKDCNEQQGRMNMDYIDCRGDSREVVHNFIKYLKRENVKFLGVLEYPDDGSIECYSSVDASPHLNTLSDIVHKFLDLAMEDNQGILFSSDIKTKECGDDDDPFNIISSRPSLAAYTLESWRHQNRSIDISSSLPGTLENIAHKGATKKMSLFSMEQVETHLAECFKQIQQVPCKAIAKQCIKMIEPRKQTSHPYKNGDISKPQWWPEAVRHVEPDHLKKDERVILLVSIMLHVAKADSCIDPTILRQKVEDISKGLLNDFKLSVLDEIFYIVEKKRNYDAVVGVYDEYIEVSDFAAIKELGSRKRRKGSTDFSREETTYEFVGPNEVFSNIRN